MLTARRRADIVERECFQHKIERGVVDEDEDEEDFVPTGCEPARAGRTTGDCPDGGRRVVLVTCCDALAATQWKRAALVSVFTTTLRSTYLSTSLDGVSAVWGNP